MKAVILAAGHGNRFRPHTDMLAKPALPFLNLPLLAYSAYHLKDLGLEKVFINTHHLPDTVVQATETIKPLFKAVEFSDEQPIILDSAGALDKLRGELHAEKDFLVMNADSLFFSENPKLIADFIKSHQKNKALASFMTCPKQGAGSDFSAMWVNENNNYCAVGKDKGDGGLKPQHFAGVYCLSAEIFKWIPPGQPSHILLDVIAQVWKDEGHNRTFCFEQNLLEWFETGNLENYISATQTCVEALFEFNNVQTSKLGKALADCLNTYGVLSTQQFYSEGESQVLSMEPLSQEVLKHCEGFCVFGGKHTGQLGDTLKNSVLYAGCELPTTAQESKLIL